MAWFDFRREDLADDELRDRLFEAVAGSDNRTVKNLTRRHRERIVALFPTWTTLPPAVRSDPSQVKFWGEGVIGVASAMSKSGDQSLMAQLVGPPEDNILISWQRAFISAQADAERGMVSSAIRTLEPMLERTAGMTGPGMDDLLPKTYGLLGTLYYNAGETARAREFTIRAKDYCARTGDHEGTDIYSRNLEMMAEGRNAPAGTVAFRDAQGRLLTVEEVLATEGAVRFEMTNEGSVPQEAQALHERGRAAGERGNHDEALAIFTSAADLAPTWPYPVYDRAFTHLLMENFDAALSDYRRASDLAPRGFFTAVTAVDTLVREQKGEFPSGLYLAFVMLETVDDRAQQRHVLQQIVDKYPGFAPAWQQLANLIEDGAERLNAIEKGLAANPDRETKGMLLLNKALVLQSSGSREAAVRLLGELVADPDSLATEALAKAMLKLIPTK